VGGSRDLKLRRASCGDFLCDFYYYVIKLIFYAIFSSQRTRSHFQTDVMKFLSSALIHQNLLGFHAAIKPDQVSLVERGVLIFLGTSSVSFLF
jgi:hypothetical protein